MMGGQGLEKIEEEGRSALVTGKKGRFGCVMLVIPKQLDSIAIL